MIGRDTIRKVGRILKPYSYHGEVLLVFDAAAFAEIMPECYFCEMDGLCVPFFVDEIKRKGDKMARVKFDDVDDEHKAARLSNAEVYLPRALTDELAETDTLRHDEFIGFHIFDDIGNDVGLVTHVDDSTENILFIVDNGGEEVMIPATADFIEHVDFAAKKLFMRLPEGLL